MDPYLKNWTRQEIRSDSRTDSPVKGRVVLPLSQGCLSWVYVSGSAMHGSVPIYILLQDLSCYGINLIFIFDSV